MSEALKFGVVGGINTVVNYAVFNALALTILVNGQLKATIIATIVATISSYLMNRHWTYRDRPKSTLRREYTLFFLFNGIGLLIELCVLGLAKYGLGITNLLALNVVKTIGLVLGTLFRFWSYRTFVFRPAPPPARDERPDTTPSADRPPAEWDAEALHDDLALTDDLSETWDEEFDAFDPDALAADAVAPQRAGRRWS